jgi:hypothetical protein
MNAPVDYDFHGLAGIRLLDASPGDIAAVMRQVGPLRAPLRSAPDLSIRFVDQLPVSSRIRYLGLGDAGFTDDAFLVLKGKYKSRARVQIPFDRIGRSCEIVCERGLLEVPLLIPILNLTILGKGALPLHASALTYRNTGVLAMGWSKGGKTEVLLAFMANGASYVGDEWVYLTPDGRHMYGIPQPIRIWKWHLRSLPQYGTSLRRTERLRLGLTAFLAATLDRTTAGGRRNGFPLGTTGNRVKALLERQLYVDVPPHRLFGEEACKLAGVPERILFVASHDSPEVTVRPIDPQEVAKRMVFSFLEEQQTLTSYYWKFRFAFPEASNELIEGSRELQSEILSRALKGKQVLEVLHPYPVHLPSLFEAIRES